MIDLAENFILGNEISAKGIVLKETYLDIQVYQYVIINVLYHNIKYFESNKVPLGCCLVLGLPKVKVHIHHQFIACNKATYGVNDIFISGKSENMLLIQIGNISSW